MALSRDDVLTWLKEVKDLSGNDMVSGGLVRAINVEDVSIRFVMEVGTPDRYMSVKAEAHGRAATHDASAWDALDVLIVDLPPGTGDVQMTLAQTCQVTDYCGLRIADPGFPPLLSSQPVSGAISPFDKACVEAMKGCDAGPVF